MARSSYLAVIGDHEVLAWVLRGRQAGFPSTHRADVDGLAVADELFLVTTRGCFHNPSRDRTRVVARASIVSPVAPLSPRVDLAGRAFTRACRIDIANLAPYLDGVEVGPLVDRLDAFPDGVAWSVRLQRPLVPLSDRDARLVRTRLARVAGPYTRRRKEYLAAIRPFPH